MHGRSTVGKRAQAHGQRLAIPGLAAPIVAIEWLTQGNTSTPAFNAGPELVGRDQLQEDAVEP